jgi:protein SCO1/2
MKYVFFISLLAFAFTSCVQENENASGLPVMGRKLPIEKEVNGKMVIDSLEHTIPAFSFVDQDSTSITEKTMEGKVYLADFFFTSCFTICPKVKKNMKKAYNTFKDRPDFAILSHSIDTRHDTVGRLAWYANKFDINSSTWHLMTGDKDAIYKIAYDYYVTALESPDAPGGFDHSGAVVLVDKKRRIRGMYDGTDPERMDELVEDIQLLLDKE